MNKTGDWTGDKNPRWNDGTKMDEHGYLLVVAPIDHPYKIKQGYIKQHRLVMEISLGRYLSPEEVVHHLDENKLNNSLKNLVLCKNKSEHLKKYHHNLGEKTWFKVGVVTNPKLGEMKECANCHESFYVRKCELKIKKFCKLSCKYESMKGYKIGYKYA